MLMPMHLPLTSFSLPLHAATIGLSTHLPRNRLWLGRHLRPGSTTTRGRPGLPKSGRVLETISSTLGSEVRFMQVKSSASVSMVAMDPFCLISCKVHWIERVLVMLRSCAALALNAPPSLKATAVPVKKAPFEQPIPDERRWLFDGLATVFDATVEHV